MRKNLMVVILLLVLFAYFPGRMTLNSRSAALEEADVARARASDIELQVSRARTGAGTDLQARLDEVAAAMPSQLDYTQLIDAIRQASSASGVEVESATITNPELLNAVPAEPTALMLNFSITGGLQQVQGFIAAIESLPWVTTLSTLTINLSDTGSVTVTLPVNLYMWDPSGQPVIDPNAPVDPNAAPVS